MPIISIHKAAEELGDTSFIKSNPKRMGNKWWERMRERELRRKAKITLDPLDPITDFPAVKMGRKWMVDTEALTRWRKRHFQVA